MGILEGMIVYVLLAATVDHVTGCKSTKNKAALDKEIERWKKKLEKRPESAFYKGGK